MGYPPNEEITRAQNAIAELQPGAPESLILNHFEIIHSFDWGKYGIMDIDEYRSASYVSRTYWIGYYYNSGAGGTGESRVLAITAVNGKIDSVYRP